MDINVLGIDIAKNIFQLCAVNKKGEIIKEQTIKRNTLLTRVKELAPKQIAMEACGGANYWAREFEKLNINVKLIAPQYVKPFVKGNKNDKQDARAIVEAAQRPTMRFVSPKTVDQQVKQTLLRIREGYLEMRTKITNQVRGLLAEYGVTIAKSINQMRLALPKCFDRTANTGLSAETKTLLEMQYNFLVTLDNNISDCDKQIKIMANEDEACQRLQGIEGVGQITALAIVSLVGNNPHEFKNGRHFAAYLGLVPKQRSSGGKHALLGISKRGDNYVRKLLIHGGRSVTRTAENKTDQGSLWVTRLKRERGSNKAAVAVANKNARIIISMLKSGQPYQQAA